MSDMKRTKYKIQENLEKFRGPGLVGLGAFQHLRPGRAEEKIPLGFLRPNYLANRSSVSQMYPRINTQKWWWVQHQPALTSGYYRIQATSWPQVGLVTKYCTATAQQGRILAYFQHQETSLSEGITQLSVTQLENHTRGQVGVILDFTLGSSNLTCEAILQGSLTMSKIFPYFKLLST